MNCFKCLPVVNSILPEGLKVRSFTEKEIILVMAQHILESTGSMLGHIISFGIKPQNIFWVGKEYSTDPSVENRIKACFSIKYMHYIRKNTPSRYLRRYVDDINKLWRKVSDRIDHSSKQPIVVILDDGGLCTKHIPGHIVRRCRVIAIEQTTSGLMHTRKSGVPVIAVASSAAKKYLEPAIISDAIIRALRKEVPSALKDMNAGIIGTGNLGSVLVKKTIQEFNKAYVYDRSFGKFKEKGAVVCNSGLDLVSKADLILGCTGVDVSSLNWLGTKKKELYLASCSTGEIEFGKLLRHVLKSGLYHKQVYKKHSLCVTDNSGKSRVIFIGNGFPINFIYHKEIEKASHMQLTRALMFAGLVQGLTILNRSDKIKKGNIMLSPVLQKRIVDKWLEKASIRNMYDVKCRARFKSAKTIYGASEGKYLKSIDGIRGENNVI